jgi:hypothetical protein
MVRADKQLILLAPLSFISISGSPREDQHSGLRAGLEPALVAAMP